MAQHLPDADRYIAASKLTEVELDAMVRQTHALPAEYKRLKRLLREWDGASEIARAYRSRVLNERNRRIGNRVLNERAWKGEAA